jgi:general nucleoside transport system permease protein
MESIIISIISSTLRLAAPLTLGALSGVFCERSGVVNIAIEGMMLTSAFFSFVVALYMKSLWLGLAAGLLAGVLMALLHAILSIRYKVDQIISGTVINIMAVGITGYFHQQMFEQNMPAGQGTFTAIKIPILSDIPNWGTIFRIQPIALTAIVLVFVADFVLFHTTWGLRTRAVGEHPRAADTVGINVFFMRYANVLIGGLLAGLGGAYFTLESIPYFSTLMTNGKGFIALAAMIFGKWTPIGSWLAVLLFASAESLQVNMQILGIKIPNQFVGMLPYLLTMIVLAGVVGRATSPAADGTPYEKQ